jgi:hypothetical protein
MSAANEKRYEHAAVLVAESRARESSRRMTSMHR